MRTLILVALTLASGCGPEPQCEELVQERYLECAGAEVQVELETCSLACEAELESSTCDTFKAVLSSEVCQ